MTRRFSQSRGASSLDDCSCFSGDDMSREPLPTDFRPFWRFLLGIFLLTAAIGLVSLATGLALSR